MWGTDGLSRAREVAVGARCLHYPFMRRQDLLAYLARDRALIDQSRPELWARKPIKGDPHPDT